MGHDTKYHPNLMASKTHLLKIALNSVITPSKNITSLAKVKKYKRNS